MLFFNPLVDRVLLRYDILFAALLVLCCVLALRRDRAASVIAAQV
jgi:hypothetical protein